ncbi:MAG: hypothetical protein IPM82_12115 [Saprospiraceae bacterium]|nr:hypothetical protein [Saprospiraceae bacterium]
MTENISIPIGDVAFGTYLMRIQVDGAESPLEWDADTAQYIAPILQVP